MSAQRSVNVVAAHGPMSPPVRIESMHPASLTQPRTTVSNALHPTVDECVAGPSTSGLRASEFQLNPAYFIDEADRPGETGILHLASNRDRGLSEPLPRVVRAAWETTGALQGFYGAEFSHALQCAGIRLAQLEGATLREALEANFRTLRTSTCNGTGIRAWRDALSFAVSVPIVVGVGMQMAIDTATTGALGFDSFRHANLPFGSVAASYGLMCAEVIKAPLTAGLSYQTIARHHMVDDYLTRTECTLKLADAVLNQLGAAGSACLPGLSRLAMSRRTGMACYEAGEVARHLSTVFTMLNYLIAPVRVGLFANNELAWPGRLDEPDWMAPLVGLLRFASSMSDTIRVLLSQIGTQCRHELFSLRMEALLDVAEYLSLRIRALQNDAGTRDRVETALEQFRTLCALSTNDVLGLLARDQAALAEALRSSRGGHDIRVQTRIGHNLEPFGVRMSQMVESGERRLHLYLEPRQNHWGKVSGRHATWWDHAQFPLRLTYRFTLILQHWLASVVHRLTEPCEPPLQRCMQR
ncbi:hypothetical protein [Pararobbsia alpina]|uniref:hypothetical protein n=1 Tax=Pararobbsia alpina TaxID=621374 RepID=UPI001582B161|nr:hypothetical protein [Pararobbsia alpina]